MSTTKQQNRIIRYFIRAMKEMAPALIHKCPFLPGRYEFMNIKVPKIAAFLPIGLHRWKIDFFEKNPILNLEFDFEIRN